jgi:hypothetical protein
MAGCNIYSGIGLNSKEENSKMIAAKEKALDQVNVAELARSISKELQAWGHITAHSPSALSQDDFKEIVRWLKTWRKKNPSGEELFAALMLLCLASFVESEVGKRLEKVFTDKLASVLK